MVAKEESVSEVGSDADSGWSGVSNNSSTDSECTDMEASSIASDQDRFDTAYEALQDLANDLYYIDLKWYSRCSTSEDAAGVLLVDGHEKLQEMVYLPRTWPLARLTICENHVRELRTFFTVVLEPNIHTFSVLSETLQDFLKSKLC